MMIPIKDSTPLPPSCEDSGSSKPAMVLVTGTAGFIGFHLARRLLERGDAVVGLDNINDYYDVRLKYGRLAEMGIEESRVRDGAPVQSSVYPNYRFVKVDLKDRESLARIFQEDRFDRICHLAAQAGVRYSLENPQAYVESNLVGFVNVAELCRSHAIDHLVYASSSSVYGLNAKTPYSVNSDSDHPASLYGATKKSNELIAHSYSHLYRLPTTGLRFFTVYGPWGRPDMAYFAFVRAILENKPIDIYNNGDMERDFTYIDDVVEGIMRVIDRPPSSGSGVPFSIYNIGHGSPVRLLEFVGEIEEALGRKAIKRMLPMQPGDVKATWADTTDLFRDFGYRPTTSVRQGIHNFIKWYMDYYH